MIKFRIVMLIIIVVLAGATAQSQLARSLDRDPEMETAASTDRGHNS